MLIESAYSGAHRELRGAESAHRNVLLRPEGILAFDMQGNLLHHWKSADKVDGHLILTDLAGDVWVGSDTMRKYTKDGKLLAALPRVSTANPKPGDYPADTR